MKWMRTLGMATAVLAAIGGSALVGSPASADWNGKPCQVQITEPGVTGNAWGWCDGTGPQRYEIWIKCENGKTYVSASKPWFGDRRGASVWCPSGLWAVTAGGRRA